MILHYNSVSLIQWFEQLVVFFHLVARQKQHFTILSHQFLKVRSMYFYYFSKPVVQLRLLFVSFEIA
jgi:hypothetical protein